MADTAALVVALSAQLTKFEKDMKGAVDIANTRTKEIETRFTKMNSEINNQLSGIASGFSSRIGGFGSVLGALGPIGASVAIGLGAAVLAMNSLINTATEFAEKQRRLKEAAETTGLTINQFKTLGRAAAAVGVDADKFEGGISKMNAAIEELQKNASGPLFDALRKFPDLLTELSNAKDPAEAINILARAVEGLDNQFEKSQFLRAAFGRGGFDIGRVLKQVFDAGGIKKMEEAAAAAGKTVDTELLARIVQLKIEIDKAKKAQEEFVGKMVSEDTLQAQKAWLDFWDQIIKLIGDANQRLKQGESAGGAMFRAIRNRIFGDTSGLSGITTGPMPEADQLTSPGEQAGARPRQPPALDKTLEQRIRDLNDLITALGGAATQTELFTQKELALEKQLKEGSITQAGFNRAIEALNFEKTITGINNMIAALGGAATQSELFRQKQLQLDKQLQTGAISQSTYNRAIEQERFVLAQSAEAARERFGVATEQAILDAKYAAIQKDVANGLLTATEATKAFTIAEKEAKEQAEQFQVRLSRLPELTRFGLDAANTFKQFDQVAVSTFGNFENSLADVAVGTTTLAEAFKKMADSIIRDLIRIALRMSVTGPLANALGGLFTPVTGGFDPTHGFNAAGTAFRQSGGSVSGGRPYVVGEHGPELFVPQSAGHVMPNAISGGRSAGGTSVEINNYVAADTETKQTRQEGPTGDRIIIDIVKKAQARGELDDVNRGRFGLRPAKVR